MHRLKWLFTWDGRVSRREYLAAGTILVAVKYAIDWSVAARFDEPWRFWNYFSPLNDVSLYRLGSRNLQLYVILSAIAIPFFWMGVALSLRRLADAGRSAGWVFLFFVPIANLGLFLWLSLAPGVPAAFIAPAKPGRGRTSRAVLGIVLAAALGVALVALSTLLLTQYTAGLFLGVPFLTGFVASWFLNLERTHSKIQTASVSVLTTAAIGLTLLGLRYEGVVCLLMALPLAVPFSAAGGLLAWHILRLQKALTTPPTFAAWLAILPLMMLAEHAAKLEPPVTAVTTSVTINAPASVVWKNVIAFPPLAPPRELLFRSGIAYPTSAEIVGSGPGAMRYCRFSTGDFVEPITVWDENRLLAFNVSSQPPSMRELSPWKITPPHLQRNYMRSRKGQFRLVALGENRTLLEGTTWYQDYFWPQAYWRAWSDAIVHQIHLRVLRHVKQQAESQWESREATEPR